MSEKLIPEHIDPFRFAEQNLTLDGAVKLADMPRLGINLVSQDALVKARLTFGVDEQRVTFLKGHVDAGLMLQCQRCMEPFKYEIIADFVLGIVNTLEEANALSDNYEPALTKDGHLALRELIEDELILNLPIIPRHEPKDCKVKLPLTDTDVEWKEGERENPFQVLESLKHKQR